MNKKASRIVAIIALAFMGVFVGALLATLLDSGLLYGGIGYLALGAGIVVVVLFALLKLGGNGYSMTDINNEIEMDKIAKENEQLIEQEQENKEN